MAAEPRRTGDRREVSGLRGVISAVASGIVVVDRSGRVPFVNPVACELFGRPLAALVGVDFRFPVVAGWAADVELRAPDCSARVVEMRVTTRPGATRASPARAVARNEGHHVLAGGQHHGGQGPLAHDHGVDELDGDLMGVKGRARRTAPHPAAGGEAAGEGQRGPGQLVGQPVDLFLGAPPEDAAAAAASVLGATAARCRGTR